MPFLLFSGFQTRNFRSHHQLRHPDADPAVQLRPVGGAHDGAVEELLDAAEGAADEKPKKRRTGRGGGRISVGRSTRICKQWCVRSHARHFIYGFLLICKIF
ncbi:hypothetical protein AVEN_24370-1 [Araneus ventricosus]|uniref:Uncharacterized protein n=1 Tax=Araneus ventricosus TaxID=182803 RepID=A0A4Y2HVA7_ARAVE|nr:hypothetical protein AVEN_24370-1 [Araneus ventricosus]